MAEPIVSTVLLVIAMEAEAQPLITAMGLQLDSPPKIMQPAPCVTFSGTQGSLAVHVVWNGKCNAHGVDNVGTVPAALATYLATQAFKPDLIISTGTAGGFKSQGAAIGDVFVSSAVMNHDRRIPIPSFEQYGVGRIVTQPCPNLVKGLNLKLGVVSSGNSLDFTDQCMAIMKAEGAAVKEMEAAAVAWTAHLFGVPMLCIKSVTDIVDGDRATQHEFLENLSAAAASLQGTLPKVLEFIAGKPLSAL
mmetsp:Transcript_2039/g.3190  ORF Transcript_2039/g.3190 Transcript_2039/m.3190 type:complete len:248 (-) Transcript_2039:609-1352(-)|eukprot:CAMPEP_0119107706 /NCGR_PEP_ID=MMETSP1180-20130426/11553_1 /TAXON_ID=3052 ORGANISM="Chlamydomonas cf sp, Strain CCMP681" /NCGR_SAMPLE_ID=MMETSP1180 /ASSEMBLY_ACC=CAM_ASM_000741 /LENGTH=247 /DNA_ID=CAMNT_0007093229 /DNA_START=57 /DNA_END=800 /DNA_ORIENTATION=+